ncbi:EpsG family protein [Pseudomonas sp. JZ134]|uniref:EpsG family protein n=1 Tax=Pseudomonas sp. JZ134 TaxID=2806615 RepID=UPI003D9FFE45
MFFISAFFVYFFFIGLSYKSGSDWYNYLADYNAGCVNPNFELGYKAVCSGFSFFGINYWFFSAFIKCFYISVLGWVLWRARGAPLAAFVLYVLLSIVFLENMLRQQLAAAFVLLALLYMRKGNLVAFFLLFCASLFHLSALVCIPVVFLFRSAVLRSFFLSLSILFFFFQSLKIFNFASIAEFFLPYLSGYNFAARVVLYVGFDHYPMTLGHLLRLVLLLLYSILFYFSSKRDLEVDTEYWLRLSYSAVLLMFFYEMVFYDFGVFWMRVREFFTVFLVIFPFLLARYFKPHLWLVVFLTVTAYSVYVFYGLFSLPVFDSLYKGYSNSALQLISRDIDFDRQRDMAVEEYWLKWKAGELR